MSRTVLSATTEGLKQRLAKIERDVADLHRDQSWQFDPPDDAKLPFFVAASDASGESRAAASYVCSGVDDHLVINQAIADATASGWGARVQLSEGQFSTTGTIGPLSTNIHLAGMGRATYIASDTPKAIEVDGNATVSDLVLDNYGAAAGSTGISLEGGDVLVRGVVVQGYQWCVKASMVLNTRIIDSWFQASSGGADYWCVYLDPSVDTEAVTVEGNIFNGSGASGVYCAADMAAITGNVFRLTTHKAVQVTGETVSVTGNVIDAPSATLDTTVGAIMSSGNRTTIASNAISVSNRQAIFLDGGDAHTVIGNAVGGHLRLACDRATVVGNNFDVDASNNPTIVVASGVDNGFASNFLPGGLGAYTDFGTTTQRGTNFAQGGSW